MNGELDRWFLWGILPHGSALTRYLDRMLKPTAEIADLRREAKAFGGLPQITKQAIWLRRVEDMSQFEAALRLWIKEGALEEHMSRGLRRLMRKMN